MSFGRPSAVRTARPNVALIVFGILAILGVLGAIVGVVIYIVSRIADASGPKEQPAAPAPVKAEVRELQRGSDPTGGLMFVGEVTNTGTLPIASLVARVALYDARHAPLGLATCSPPLGFLAAGEKLPCTFSFGSKHPAFTTFEGAVDAQPMTAAMRPVRLSITTGKMTQLGAGWSIDGTLHNDGATPARTVVVYASITAVDGRLAGAGWLTLTSAVQPAASAPFRIVIPDAIAPAKNFGLRVVGTE